MIWLTENKTRLINHIIQIKSFSTILYFLVIIIHYLHVFGVGYNYLFSDHTDHFQFKPTFSSIIFTKKNNSIIE